MVTKEQIGNWINRPETVDSVDINEVAKLLTSYPYCEKLHWVYLRCLYVNNDVNFDSELIALGLYISNRRLFYNYITFELATETDSTPHTDHSLELGQPVTPDYFSLVENEEKNQQSLHELAAKLKAARLARAAKIEDENRANSNSKNDEKTVKKEHKEVDSEPIHHYNKEDEAEIGTENAPQTDIISKKRELDKQPIRQEDNAYYSEENAKRLIQEKRYSEAYKILMAINLNNPKKSVYFALQIKYLETIINNNNKSI